MFQHCVIFLLYCSGTENFVYYILVLRGSGFSRETESIGDHLSVCLSPCLLISTLCVCTQLLSHVWLFETLWSVTHPTPLSMGFSRQEYWTGLPCPPPGDLPDPGIEPASPESPALQADSSPLSHWGSPMEAMYPWPHTLPYVSLPSGSSWAVSFYNKPVT